MELIRELLLMSSVEPTDDDIVYRQLLWLKREGFVWVVYKPDFETVAHYTLNPDRREQLLETLRHLNSWNARV